MKFIIIPLLTWVISQTIKFGLIYFKKNRRDFQTAWWIYMWAGGTPSTHSAVLTVTLFILGYTRGFDAIFGFCMVVTLLLMYNLADDHKHQILLEKYLTESADPQLKKIESDGEILNMSGHNFSGILAGALLGILIGVSVMYLGFI